MAICMKDTIKILNKITTKFNLNKRNKSLDVKTDEMLGDQLLGHPDLKKLKNIRG